jgi:hypothetical protein
MQAIPAARLRQHLPVKSSFVIVFFIPDVFMVSDISGFYKNTSVYINRAIKIRLKTEIKAEKDKFYSILPVVCTSAQWRTLSVWIAEGALSPSERPPFTR